MSITFNAVCKLLEDIEQQTIGRPRHALDRENSSTLIISNWFTKYRDALDKFDGGALLSAIFPHRRKDRVYALKPPRFSKKLIRLLNLQNGQKTMMEEWEGKKHGDLGTITEKVMKRWDGTFKEAPTISVEKVDSLLDQLAAKCRFSDPAIRVATDPEFDADSQLKWILDRLSSWEAKWLVRLLLREYCTIQIDETFFFRQFHFLLPDLLLFQNDFDAAVGLLRQELVSYPAVCEAQKEKEYRIAAAKKLKAIVGIKVGRPTFHKAWSFKNCFQLTGRCAWAAEVKYDGEYCEIHIDLSKTPSIRIFSKNGKDATYDRQAIHDTIHKALRIGQPGCLFTEKCIVLGELVLYSDKEQKILPFSKIRKHIMRSCSFLGTTQDSLPHEWEHLMVVFFDVLVLDDKQVLREGLQNRRDVLRELVQPIPGRAKRSEWYMLDFKDENGIIDLKDAFAKSLANRQEGLVLKPLHAPYFPLLDDVSHHHRGYFIKLKKGYVADMGGERDLGDFVIVGASFNAEVAAAKADIKPLHWTHFHIGCLVNKADVDRSRAKPMFKIVGALSINKCIPKVESEHLNSHGRLYEMPLQEDGHVEMFNYAHSYGYCPKMTVAFTKPFVVEILGGGYEKLQNESFEMLRHPRVIKIHHDRTWEDSVTMGDLERMANQKWEVPDVDKLSGHARDVALLVRKYVKQLHETQICTVSQTETTQETTQQTTQRTSQTTPRQARPMVPNGAIIGESPIESPLAPSERMFEPPRQSTPRSRRQETPEDAVIRETQPFSTQGTASTTSQCSTNSTQRNGIRASKQIRSFLIREDTGERIAQITRPTLALQHHPKLPLLLTPPVSSEIKPVTPPRIRKRRTSGTDMQVVTSPPTKRMNARSPLGEVGSMKIPSSSEFDPRKETLSVVRKKDGRIGLRREKK